MASQQQDLIFYNDNSLILDAELSHNAHQLQIVSHKEGTNPSWFINSLLENSLVGTANLVNRDLRTKKSGRSLVTFISFQNNAEYVTSSCRKQGLDLASMSNFTFVDCFSDLFTKKITNPTNSANQLKSVFLEVLKQIEDQKTDERVVFVEGLEILLAATDASSNDILLWIQKLGRSCRSLFVISNTEAPLIDLDNSNPLDPVFKITDFYVKLHHRSSLNIHLMPLSTGRAKDITGSLTVTKGTLPSPLGLQVVEKEYIYHLSKESTVKLFFR